MSEKHTIRERNPRMQCGLCGQWKRLNGVDDEGNAIQRFHACCKDKGGEINVCDKCCEKDCKETP